MTKGIIFLSGIGLLGYLTGINWQLMIVWLILVIFDLITGIIYANKKSMFSSKEMKNGLYKKVVEAMVLLGVILCQYVALSCGITIPMSVIFISAFCFKEFGSIVENAIKLNVNIPKSIIKWFKVTENIHDITSDNTLNELKNTNDGENSSE